MPRYSQKKIKTLKKALIEGLNHNMGILYPVLKQIDVNYPTYKRWMESDPEFAEKVDETYDIAIDWVESQLYKKIKEGDKTSIIFFLKTKGATRRPEWKEHHKIEQSVTYKEPLKLNIIVPEQNKIDGNKNKLIE